MPLVVSVRVSAAWLGLAEAWARETTHPAYDLDGPLVFTEVRVAR